MYPFSFQRAFGLFRFYLFVFLLVFAFTNTATVNSLILKFHLDFIIPNCRFWAAHGEFQEAPASAFVAPELRHSGLSATEATLLGLLTFLLSSPAEGLVSRDTQLSVCSYFCFSMCLCQEAGHFTVEDTVSVVGSFLPFFQHTLSFGWEPHPVLGVGEIKTNSLNYKAPNSVGLGPQTKGPVLKWFPV